ncbi:MULTISPECIES: GNAT family N-acetyltransferase [Pseudoalteromonas]|uniref:GNAT family N-acetyltransferase n=1 Tax=Pseudoalteromonas amylolytica TaxID=1859457 RepID=A0A1S1MTD0_9GAMM|nr:MULTISPECIES: GNAT family N-acetyltransferase [Pseudoalteromonas]OHU84295.1 GNAT family N-acetyltransferase [Pseudoalteromonas sp. JW3]OHU87166.1 GNAT family N-acetyltransferase [Pseudoalteromonas amylolytica]
MITEITKQDFVLFWPTFESIIKAQQTYAFDPDMTLEQAYHLWCETPLKAFAFKANRAILGTYYLKANAMGPSSHICNCGYMVSEAARGQGIAQKLCEHSQRVAQSLGFKAMQFNSVVSSNEGAIRLWKKLGYDIIGTIPKAYKHPQLGYIDSFIMHKLLDE